MNSSNGFQTNVWGAPFWFIVHIVSLNYTPDRKRDYHAFFKSLAGVLPCKACRENYAKIIRNKIPLTATVLESRENLAYWLFLVHNQVRKDIFAKTDIEHDAPHYNDTRCDFVRAMAVFEKYRAQCHKNSYGCTVPVKGSRRRSTIRIARFSKPRQKSAFVNIE